jgi:glycosyltransferase involved in cell wall biosynthesis
VSRAVLTVLPDLPVPATTGLQLRLLVVLHVIQALGARSSAVYFDNGEPRGRPEELADLCETVTCAGRTRPYATFSVGERVLQRVAFTVDAARARLGTSYPFSLPYDAIGAGERIADEAARVGAHVVLLPTFLGHYAPRLRADGLAVIGEATDVLEIQARNLLRRHGRRHPERIPGLLASYLATRSLERLALPLCAEIWANSEPQAAELARIAPGTAVIVVGNVLDEAEIAPSPLGTEPVVGFIGSYRYTPNLDAARHLVERVGPTLRARVPDARVALAGAGLPAEVERRWAADGIDVRGRVADSGEFMRSCRVLAFPLFFESGPPLKVVEALARARPTVVSPQVGAALGLRDGHDALIASTARAGADAIARVMRDDVLAEHLARHGRETFERRFSLRAAVAEARRHSMLSADRGG